MKVAQALMAMLVWLALLSQLHVAAATAILPAFACVGVLQAWQGSVALERRADALEWSLLLWLALWLCSALLATHVAHAFALSLPLLLFALCFVLFHRGAPAVLESTIVTLAVLASAQSLQLLASAGSATPALQVQGAGSPWLLVPNDVVWMLCLWPLWWVRARAQAGFRRLLFASAFVVQALAIVSVQSRLAAVAMAALVLFALHAALGRSSWSRRHRALFALAVGVGMALVAVLWAAKGWGSLWARVQLWQAALMVWRDDPWLGAGPHAFGLVYPAADIALVDPRRTPWPHQLLLELLANTGVLGMLAFLAVGCCTALRWNWLNSLGRAPDGLGAALLSFATFSLLEATPLRVWWWVVLAVLLGSCRPDQAKDSA